ncbi:MAG: transcriptional regulator [Ramlibacter sp.]|jgi:hypothetical protein|nr:transcriptional regulator [Ramlibacter sp.]
MHTEIHRREVDSLRRTMKALHLIVAETDADLRYVWIENPHPDFDAAEVIGRRDDELISGPEAEPLMALKRQVLAQQRPDSRVITVRRSDGDRSYSVMAYPILETDEQVRAVLTVGFSSASPPADDR